MKVATSPRTLMKGGFVTGIQVHGILKYPHTGSWDLKISTYRFMGS